MKIRFKNFARFILLTVIISIILLIFILYGESASNGVINGIKLCSGVIIPSLFPITILSLFALKSGSIFYLGSILNKFTKKVFNISGTEFSVFILSLIGGYPIGAKLINNLYNDNLISKKRGEKLIYCSVNAGPVFIICTVGEIILGNKNIGIILFISNLSVSFIMLILLFFKDKNVSCASFDFAAPTVSDSFVLSVEETCKIFINICGFIILFSAVTEVVFAISGYEILCNLSKLLFEISIATVHGKTLGLPVFLYSFLLSFGGISTICQIKSAASNINISFLKISISRVLHGTLTSAVTYLILKIFPQTESAISNGVLTVFGGFDFNISSIFLMILAVFYIIYLKQ